jgi:hypothetical protein
MVYGKIGENGKWKLNHEVRKRLFYYTQMDFIHWIISLEDQSNLKINYSEE